MYCVQFFFGAWFLYNGLNFFVTFFPQPSGSSPLSHELIGALIHSKLFAVVKALEALTGLAFLANRFVPLAAVLAFPISFSIAHLNIIANGDAFSLTTGVVVVLLNGIIAVLDISIASYRCSSAIRATPSAAESKRCSAAIEGN